MLAGAKSNGCIRATAYGALERGYDVTLVEDAHSTTTITLDDGTAIEAAKMIRELNLALRRLEYPGRCNGAVAADRLEFA